MPRSDNPRKVVKHFEQIELWLIHDYAENVVNGQKVSSGSDYCWMLAIQPPYGDCQLVGLHWIASEERWERVYDTRDTLEEGIEALTRGGYVIDCEHLLSEEQVHDLSVESPNLDLELSQLSIIDIDGFPRSYSSFEALVRYTEELREEGRHPCLLDISLDYWAEYRYRLGAKVGRKGKWGEVKWAKPYEARPAQETYWNGDLNNLEGMDANYWQRVRGEKIGF